MLSFVRHALVAAVVLTPAAAGATTGGPQTLELLGYAPGDGKVYFVQHFHDESDRHPQLVYMPLRGRSAGRTIEVRSWYVDDDGTTEFRERLQARIDGLRTRLRRAKRRVPTVRMSTRADGRIHWTSPYGADLSRSGQRIRVDVRTKAGDKAGTGVVESYGCLADRPGCQRVRVVRRADLALADAVVAIVESVGIPYETGYAKQRAILLRSAGSATRS